MSDQDFDTLFGTLAQQTQNSFASLEDVSDDVKTAIKARSASDPVEWSEGFLQVLDSIDQTQVDTSLERHDPNVPADDAQFTGTMMQLDHDRNAVVLTMHEVVDRMASGVPVFIGGADASLEELFDEAIDALDPLATDTILVQYVGLDRMHWKLPDAVAKLEVNIAKTAAIQLVNAALNSAGIAHVVIATSFGAWMVNRAMRALPADMLAEARNLQIDGFGPLEAMQELAAVKLANYGRICNVRTGVSDSVAAAAFGLAAGDLAKLPLDLN